MSDFSTTSMRQANVTLAKPNVWPKHPYNNKQNHDSLLRYLQERLLVGKKTRDNEINRLIRVDKKVSGWIRLSAEDRKRMEKNELDGEPIMTHINLPLAFVHLDDMMTYLVQTFAPNRGMFYNTGTPNEIEEARQIVTKMNNDALYSGYFREVVGGLWSCLKYNLGGFHSNWGSESGPILNAGDNGARSFDTGVKWSGNRLEALDRYNTLMDPSVHPTKLYCDGEFGAFAKLRSHYWIQSRASMGQLYNCEQALSSGSEVSRATYYRHPPAEAKLTVDYSRGTTDWVAVLSEMPDALQDGHEIVTIYIRLNPVEFGLVEPKDARTRNRYEIWRFMVLDDMYIVSATWMNNIHNYIPMFFGLVHDDIMSTAQKSPAEILTPLQDFASFLLNTHMEGTRDNIWGTTYYDPTMVKLDKVPKGEVAARIPVEPKAYGKDIRTYIYQAKGEVDTKQTMTDLESLMTIINQFFPTQAMPSQIASIDRAISDQVAAVQQGVNRRQQKTARLLDDTIFRPLRFTMYYNILQYMPDGGDITDYYTGKSVKIDLAKLKDTSLPFIIGQGLKAIDRTATAQMIQQVLFALIQAPAAGQQFDIPGLVNFWTDMLDVEMDMTQFRLQPPPQPGQPGTEPGQPGAEAANGGNPITPVTNPQAVTGPIYQKGAG